MEFSDKDYKFLKAEFGLDKESVDSLTDDELIKLQDECFEIEGEEVVKAGNGELSERGEIATRLVDVIHGPYDSSEFDAEMAGDD